MAIVKNVTGFADIQGTGQKGKGKPYSIGRLFRLNPIREWENEHGRAKAAGFNADEMGALDIDLGRPPLVRKLMDFQYPLDLEITVEPHPEDPLKNVIVDAQPAQQESKVNKPAGV